LRHVGHLPRIILTQRVRLHFTLNRYHCHM